MGNNVPQDRALDVMGQVIAGRTTPIKHRTRCRIGPDSGLIHVNGWRFASKDAREKSRFVSVRISVCSCPGIGECLTNARSDMRLNTTETLAKFPDTALGLVDVCNSCRIMILDSVVDQWEEARRKGSTDSLGDQALHANLLPGSPVGNSIKYSASADRPMNNAGLGKTGVMVQGMVVPARGKNQFEAPS